ncbi:hypothetical protein [Streptomyces sp. NP-1717]|uniref:hypothetical protein n=1 Tax=Streptomyces sp. NP-1717 TaxID=2704470 RepID=UPI001F5D19EA|nr:hypothetical protein [Streptomyces sp. NP-1717]MCI3222565.1 hypothetical protein [Streptomyces sp. NP-1717]
MNAHRSVRPPSRTARGTATRAAAARRPRAGEDRRGAVCPLEPGREPAAYSVRVRFTPSEIPGLTSGPVHRGTAIRAAGLALAAHGRGYLGGHLEITSDAPARLGRIPAASERLATVRAVEDALRGGSGTVRLPLPGPWPGVTGGRAAAGTPRSD